MGQGSLFDGDDAREEASGPIAPPAGDTWRILHTADWHLGKRLERVDRLPEQRQVLEEIIAIADHQQVDAVIIAGDLFDTFNPPTEAVDLFYHTLRRLTRDGHRPVIGIAGNHDSPDRIEAPDPLARECGIILTGYPHTEIKPFELPSGLKVTQSAPGFVELSLPEKEVPLRLLLTPYANEVRLKTYLGEEDPEAALRDVLQEQWSATARRYCDEKGVNVLVTHLFMVPKGTTLEEEPPSEKPILHVGGAQAIHTANVPEEVQYVALGHLHRRIVMDNGSTQAVYSGSPLTYDFGETGQQNSVTIAELAPGEPARHEKISLKEGKLLWRARFDSVGEAVAGLKEKTHCWVELTVGTDQYLTAEDRQRLREAHEGVVTLIPDIRDKSSLEGKDRGIDLSKGREALFRDYFQRQHGQEPNEELMALFREVVAHGGDNG